MDDHDQEVNRTVSMRREAYRGRLEADPEPESRKEGRISEEGKGAEVRLTCAQRLVHLTLSDMNSRIVLPHLLYGATGYSLADRQRFSKHEL